MSTDVDANAFPPAATDGLVISSRTEWPRSWTC